MVLDGGTWTDEVNRWADDPDRFTYVPYTSICAREPAVSDSGRKTSRVLTRPCDEYRGHWDTIILDEAQYIKGRKTRWTQVIQKIARNADRIYLATGTPISNYAQELFTSLQLLYPQEARTGHSYGSYWRWVEKWFRVNNESFGAPGDPTARQVRLIGDLIACKPECFKRPPTDPCEHFHDFFDQNLGERYIQRLRDDVLPDLPPMDKQRIETPMTKRQGIEYRKMRKDCLARSVDGDLLVAWSKAASHVKLDQMATGLGIMSGSCEESGKLDRLRYDLAGRAYPTLVVAHYRESLAAAAKVAESLGARTAVISGATGKADRLRNVREFQAGKLDVLVGSLETISEGLTLTAADLVIFLEHSWKPSRNQQAIRRIHRLGQTRPVTAYDYVTPGTVDQGKRELLAGKLDQQVRALTWGVVKALL